MLVLFLCLWFDDGLSFAGVWENPIASRCLSNVVMRCLVARCGWLGCLVMDWAATSSTKVVMAVLIGVGGCTGGGGVAVSMGLWVSSLKGMMAFW